MVSSRVHSHDVQKLFLQAIMSRRVMSDKTVKVLWKKCTEVVNAAAPELDIEINESEEGWNNFLNKINNSLNPFDLEFKFIVDEVTSVKTWSLINTRGDEVAQLASDYSPTEIAYFKALVEQIVLAPNYSFSISSIAALREVSHLKQSNMTKAQAEVVLGSFVARGWLMRSKRGRYSLSARTMLELGSYLAQTYGEDVMIACVICQEDVTKGIRCATPNCKAYMHAHCYNKYKHGKNICPNCQESWANNSNMKPLGEEAAKNGQDERRQTRRSSAGNGDEDEEEQSQYLDDSQALSQSQSQSQSQAQSQSQSQSQSLSQSQSRTQVRKDNAKQAKKITNGRSKRREETPESESEEGDEDVMDIDNLASIRARSQRR